MQRVFVFLSCSLIWIESWAGELVHGGGPWRPGACRLVASIDLMVKRIQVWLDNRRHFKTYFGQGCTGHIFLFESNRGGVVSFGLFIFLGLCTYYLNKRYGKACKRADHAEL